MNAAKYWVVFGALALARATVGFGAELDAYQPKLAVSGEIRSWGNSHMAPLLAAWEEGFRKHHPQARFTDTLKGTATAQWGLQARVADLALMSREIWPYEQYGTYRRSYNFAVGVAVATGSYDVPGKSAAIAVYVHRDNPLASLSLEQLDRIFGAERTGGWQGLDWVREGVARDASSNIRQWGQLGLTGRWAHRQITPYGPPSLVTGALSFFQRRVSGGADTRNENLREFADQAAMFKALARDRDGIAYGNAAFANDGVKAIALLDPASGRFVLPSRTSVQDGSYPLARQVYIYFTVDTETGDVANPPLDPKLREFLSFILSREGQDIVARDGGYLPLTAAAARAQQDLVDHPPTGRVFRKDRR